MALSVPSWSAAASGGVARLHGGVAGRLRIHGSRRKQRPRTDGQGGGRVATGIWDFQMVKAKQAEGSALSATLPKLGQLLMLIIK